MSLWNALRLRLGAAVLPHADHASAPDEGPERERRDPKRLFLVIGLGALSWVATYVGMLELIEANLGDLAFIHKIIIGFSVAMLMVMIIWLLDKMFSPVDVFTKTCYVAGYLFLSVISVGFGFGFYWKVLESRGEASRSAESAITQVQSALFAASTRLGQLQSTLDQLTTISAEKADIERASGKSCPNSAPGDGPRRKMREEDAERFKFASDFVKGRIGTVKSDMTVLDGDLQKIVKDDRSVIDARTGNRNEFLRGVGRKLEFTVTGFNAFRTDPQLKQIRIDLAERAERTTITGAKGIVISCPDGQLQMALRGVVRAIDQLPELEKPKISAVEGSEAVIEAFRRLTATFYGLLAFKLPPSADELRELQRKAVRSIEGSGQSGPPALRSAFAEQASGLAKRDYVPLAVAIFVDLCLLLVSIGRPVNQFVGLQRGMREAEEGPVYPILARFHDIHADSQAIRNFEVFRDVIFDFNGHYHVAVPLGIPKDVDNYEALQADAHRLANLCYALEGTGILTRPISFLPPLVALRQLKRRGSKFVECYGARRPPRYKRGWDAMRSLWSETTHVGRPAFKIYRFRKGAWPEMILGAVMGAARHADIHNGHSAGDYSAAPASRASPNGYAGHVPVHPPGAANSVGPAPGHVPTPVKEPAFGHYQHRYVDPDLRADEPGHAPHSNGHDLNGQARAPAANAGGASVDPRTAAERPVAEEPREVPPPAAEPPPNGKQPTAAFGSLVPADLESEPEPRSEPASPVEAERIASRFGRFRNGN